MFSKRLKEMGVDHQIFGSDYNFRYAKVGDDLINQVNRAVSQMEVKPRDFYSVHQDHTGEVRVADTVAGDDFIIGRSFDQADGLVTDYANVALMVKFADCTPILLFDPVNKAQALLHSGWRGTAQKISHRAIEVLEKEYGTKAEDLIAFVGPSIDQGNYEVGPEVYQAFEGVDSRDAFFKPRGDKYLMSMTEANLQILLDAGLDRNNIDVSTASTYTDDRLHSARKEGPDYQLNAMISIIKG